MVVPLDHRFMVQGKTHLATASLSLLLHHLRLNNALQYLGRDFWIVARKKNLASDLMKMLGIMPPDAFGVIRSWVDRAGAMKGSNMGVDLRQLESQMIDHTYLMALLLAGNAAQQVRI